MALAEERAMPAARKPRKKELIQARIARELANLEKPVLREGVQPLNPGFFVLETIRSKTVAKKKLAARAKMKGR
jgi:hypothetical protein